MRIGNEYSVNMSLFLPNCRVEPQASFAKRCSVVANCEVPMTGKFYLQQLKKIDLRQRNTQVLLLFLGNATGFIVRFCMSVAIVAMTNKSTNSDSKVYNWDPGESNSIQGSFFWGFVIAQIPSSLIIGSWSAHKLLAVGMLASSVVNMAIPLVADWGYEAVMGCRIVMGLSQACILPCTHTLLSRWVTPLDRGRMGSFVMNGPQLGIVLALTASGYLADSEFGWPSIFYTSGIIGIVWSILFYCIGADYPPEIDKIYHQNVSTMAHNERLRIPWRAILTSIPLWALVTVHCGHNFGFYTWLTQLPTYMKSILNYDISKSGAVSALPYLTMWLMGFPISFLSDFALRRGRSITFARKICNTIGLWIPAVATITLCLIETNNEIVIIAIFSLAIGFNSGTCCGFQINHMDLSPSNFAGLLMSLTNTVANILGIIAPKICSMIVSNIGRGKTCRFMGFQANMASRWGAGASLNISAIKISYAASCRLMALRQSGDLNQWHMIFYITAVTYFVTNLIFLIFGSGEIQPWDCPKNPQLSIGSQSQISIISVDSIPNTLDVRKPMYKEDCKTHC